MRVDEATARRGADRPGGCLRRGGSQTRVPGKGKGGCSEPAVLPPATCCSQSSHREEMRVCVTSVSAAERQLG